MYLSSTKIFSLPRIPAHVILDRVVSDVGILQPPILSSPVVITYGSGILVRVQKFDKAIDILFY